VAGYDKVASQAGLLGSCVDIISGRETPALLGRFRYRVRLYWAFS
jgi:hypothetical protein